MTWLWRLLLIAALFGVGLSFRTNCTLAGNGHFEIGCKSYVECKNGVGTEIHCENNTVYSNLTRRCGDPSKVPRPCGEHIDCTGKLDGKYPDLYDKCHSYFTCNGGLFYGHNFCPQPTVFDSDSQLCNWIFNVKPPCGTKNK